MTDENQMSGKINKKIAIIGLGKMGGILVRAFLDQELINPDQIKATDRCERIVEKGREEYGWEEGKPNGNFSFEYLLNILLLCCYIVIK